MRMPDQRPPKFSSTPLQTAVERLNNQGRDRPGTILELDSEVAEAEREPFAEDPVVTDTRGSPRKSARQLRKDTKSQKVPEAQPQKSKPPRKLAVVRPKARRDRKAKAPPAEIPAPDVQVVAEEPEEEPEPVVQEPQKALVRQHSRSSIVQSVAKPKAKLPSAKSSARKLNREILRLQEQSGNLLPKLNFMRLVREIAQNVPSRGSEYRFTSDSLEALQVAAEFYVTGVFTDAQRLACHANRKTVMPRDLDLLRTLHLLIQ